MTAEEPGLPRVIDSLDELVAVVESARGVPMSGSCVVNRAATLDLLDDVREALPVEVTQAHDILVKGEDLIEDAREEADRTLAEAREEANRTVTEAREEAGRTVTDAREEAGRTVADARAHADGTVGQAHETAERTIADALAEADRIVAAANAQAEQTVYAAGTEADEIVAAARVERDRLVSETEVHRAAITRGEESVAAAEAHCERLRNDADDYVDTRLADFGGTLTKMLRSVERGREALHGRVKPQDYDRPPYDQAANDARH